MSNKPNKESEFSDMLATVAAIFGFLWGGSLPNDSGDTFFWGGAFISMLIGGIAGKAAGVFLTLAMRLLAGLVLAALGALRIYLWVS